MSKQDHQPSAKSASAPTPASAPLLQMRPFSDPQLAGELKVTEPQTIDSPETKTSFSFSDINVFSAGATPTPPPKPNILQAKLTIGESNDKYEQEADQVAARVVQQINSPQPLQPQEEEIQRSPISSLNQSPLTSPTHPSTQLPLQRKSSIPVGPASSEFESRLNSARSGGSPLASQIKNKMESAMGADFSSVKIHTGSPADQLSQSIQAKAFTTGSDVFFKQGEYNPSSRSGQALIAHELTHVVQQNGASVQRQPEDIHFLTSNSGTIQRDVWSNETWMDETARMRGCIPIGRSKLLKAIDEKLDAYNKTAAGLVGFTAEEVRNSPAISAVRQQLVEIEEAIAAWQQSKPTTDTGEVSSIRAEDVATLLRQVRERLNVVKAMSSEAIDTARQKWDGDFTSPQNHSAENYTYAINGITPGTEYREAIQADPSLYSQNNGIVSISIITQEKNTVWAPSGYILKIPSGSVAASAATDLGSDSQLQNRTKPQEIHRLEVMFGLQSPKDMAAATPEGKHNEAAVTNDGLEVIGIFIVEDPDNPGHPLEAYKKPGEKQDGKEIVRLEPVVSNTWMENYRAKESGDCPIVWIKQTPGGVINGLAGMGFIKKADFNADLHKVADEQ